MIYNFQDFTQALDQAGFTLGGGNNEGIFSLIPWDWNTEPPYPTPVKWHTGDPETDPWEWRIRVLDELNHIAYGKFFFKKSGYITRQWIPYFLAIRRAGTASTLESAYANGTISHEAKTIYQLIKDHDALPLHAIKELGAFTKDDKSRFDRALVDLQMGLYITMCGRQQKISQKGEAYGWSSTVFCTTETFWGEAVFEESGGLDVNVAYTALKNQVLLLNSTAKDSKIARFIKG